MHILEYNQKMKLTQRQKREQVFHNNWAEGQSISGFFYKEMFESPAALENKYILQCIGSLDKKKVLDLGCGIGDASIYFAKKNAKVYAIDISDKMIKFLQHMMSKYKVENKISAKVCPAENITYAENSFDVVYGNGVLHHVNIHKAQKEIKRVLKPGGEAYFIEPLSYNPVINVYRHMASHVRTVDEEPLSLRDINMFISKFKSGSHKEFHFTTLLVFLYFFFVERVHPNSERYWKKILKEGHKYERHIYFLSRLDEVLFKLIPFFRRFAWVTVIRVEK